MKVTSKTPSTRRRAMRSYARTWEEIESMLTDAIDTRREWQMFFERARRIDNKQAMKDAARNSKALEGVIKTLKWTLGEQGIEHPLD
tara:strand:- start:272 stop:532 length:261 start_codon:yes stop_codon:yes gene_type:complete